MRATRINAPLHFALIQLFSRKILEEKKTKKKIVGRPFLLVTFWAACSSLTEHGPSLSLSPLPSLPFPLFPPAGVVEISFLASRPRPERYVSVNPERQLTPSSARFYKIRQVSRFRIAI